MNSETLGQHTSQIEITNISIHGVWILARGKKLFMSYEDFPWFKEASIGKVLNVEEPTPGHSIQKMRAKHSAIQLERNY